MWYGSASLIEDGEIGRSTSIATCIAMVHLIAYGCTKTRLVGAWVVVNGCFFCLLSMVFARYLFFFSFFLSFFFFFFFFFLRLKAWSFQVGTEI